MEVLSKQTNKYDDSHEKKYNRHASDIASPCLGLQRCVTCEWKWTSVSARPAAEPGPRFALPLWVALRRRYGADLGAWSARQWVQRRSAGESAGSVQHPKRGIQSEEAVIFLYLEACAFILVPSGEKPSTA